MIVVYIAAECLSIFIPILAQISSDFYQDKIAPQAQAKILAFRVSQIYH